MGRGRHLSAVRHNTVMKFKSLCSVFLAIVTLTDACDLNPEFREEGKSTSENFRFMYMKMIEDSKSERLVSRGKLVTLVTLGRTAEGGYHFRVTQCNNPRFPADCMRLRVERCPNPYMDETEEAVVVEKTITRPEWDPVKRKYIDLLEYVTLGELETKLNDREIENGELPEQSVPVEVIIPPHGQKYFITYKEQNKDTGELRRNTLLATKKLEEGLNFSRTIHAKAFERSAGEEWPSSH